MGESNSVKEADVNNMIHDAYVGVRVYGAKVHWLRKRQPADVVPILIDALDRQKHQSLYYSGIQKAALEVLAMIGPEAAASVPALERLKADPNPRVAKAAAEVLERVRR